MSSKSNDASELTAAVPTTNAASHAPSPAHEETLVQYIVMRSDLTKQHKWSSGSLIANGSHAAVAVIAEGWQDKNVQQYVTGGDGKQMHTVVLAASDEKELLDTAVLLQNNSIIHKVWVSRSVTHSSRLEAMVALTKIARPCLTSFVSAVCLLPSCCPLFIDRTP